MIHEVISKEIGTRTYVSSEIEQNIENWFGINNLALTTIIDGTAFILYIDHGTISTYGLIDISNEYPISKITFDENNKWTWHNE